MNLNYEQDVKIDPNSLDIEWLEQPTLLLKYAKNAATMRSNTDDAKENLDIVKADVDKKIRTNPEKYGIEKITVDAVSSAILRHEDYQEANQKFLQAKYEQDMAQAALNAVNQRKDALENLVKLFGMQWFSVPKLPRDINKEWEQHQAKQAEANRVVGKMKRRTE